VPVRLQHAGEPPCDGPECFADVHRIELRRYDQAHPNREFRRLAQGFRARPITALAHRRA
jgi:hypothetical protein